MTIFQFTFFLSGLYLIVMRWFHSNKSEKITTMNALGRYKLKRKYNLHSGFLNIFAFQITSLGFHYHTGNLLFELHQLLLEFINLQRGLFCFSWGTKITIQQDLVQNDAEHFENTWFSSTSRCIITSQYHIHIIIYLYKS